MSARDLMPMVTVEKGMQSVPPPSRLRASVIGVLGRLTLVLVAVAGMWALDRTSAPPQTLKGLRYDPPRAAFDFSLTNQHSQTVRLSDFRGKVVLLFFGFTHCPDVCPTTLAKWQRIYRLLKDDADQARFVFITVDPERDTPERLKEHLELFNPAFVGLTGTLSEIEDVAREYSAFFSRIETGSAAGYLLAHTALIYVIDRDGNLALGFPLESEAQSIADDVQLLIRR